MGSIGPFQVGDPGTYTVNKVYLGAQFRLRVQFAGPQFRNIQPWPISLWGFSMYPA